jgi:hypothetical protein
MFPINTVMPGCVDNSHEHQQKMCELCDVHYSSEYCRLEHLKGNQHQTALYGNQIPKETNCDACHVEYRSISHMKEHLNSHRHRQNKRQLWLPVKK